MRRVVDGEAELFISQAVLDEVWDAPNKPTPARLGVTAERVRRLVDDLLRVAAVLTGVPVVFEYDRDPDDAHYVNLALAAGAELVVSRDRDLLDLMDVGRPEGASFRARFPDLRILDPVAFLRELDARS